ncbi:DUF2460 domain-containing protein [Acinetobacter baumannii]|uniref:DUF2460 domain-containing protein n=1 Tax=Acinetobacter baumannii TaxID=470 RepID=UPI0035BE98F5
MSDAIFPELPGLEWDLSKAPMFNTKIMTSINGRELRASFQSFPKYEISLSFGFLRERNGKSELQVIESFFLERRGSFDSFLYKMPEDNEFNCTFVGDGITQKFQIYKTLQTHKQNPTIPHYVNPQMWNQYSKLMWTDEQKLMWGDDYIGWWETEAQIEKIVLSHTEPKILAFNQSMWNRNTIKSMWVSDDALMWKQGVFEITKDGYLILSEPLALDQEITVSGTYYYRCRFKEDTQEYVNFMHKLWKSNKVDLIGSLGNKV